MPDAITIAADTAVIPIAPHNSGTNRRPRLRMSNQTSIATNGTAARTGSNHAHPASRPAITTAMPSAESSPAVTRAASRERSSHRLRRTSTRTNLSGVRTRNARNAATPKANPPADQATISPISTGSNVKPQPPCSLGIATERHMARSAATLEASMIAITTRPG